MNTLEDISKDLETYGKQFNIKVSEGYYRTVRLSTMYESFEFDYTVNESRCVRVFNMLHVPMLYGMSVHKEFKSDLNVPFSLLDCFVYVNVHSASKFGGSFVKYPRCIMDKIEDRKRSAYNASKLCNRWTSSIRKLR